MVESKLGLATVIHSNSLAAECASSMELMGDTFAEVIH